MALFSRTPGQAIRTGTPEQQQFQNESLRQAMQILNGQGGLNPIGQQAVQRFNTQTVPSLAERFSSLGSGSQRSSAFRGALENAGQGLQQDLSAQQYGLMGLLSQFGQEGTLYQPEQPGFFENLLNQLFQISPQIAGAIAAGISGSGRIPTTGQPAPQFGPKAPISGNTGFQLGGNSFGNGFQSGAPQNAALNQILGGGY